MDLANTRQRRPVTRRGRIPALRMLSACLPAALSMVLCSVPRTSQAEPSTASPAYTPSISLLGFGTLGFARSNDDDAEFVRDLSQAYGVRTDWSPKIDSLLGVQANMRLTPQTNAVVQALSRYRYDGSYGPEISWAFLRHEFSSQWAARAGRMGTDFYMHADSRLVGYANLTVRPPQDFYGQLIFSYFDGVDVTGTFPLGNGLLEAKLFAGQAAEKTSMKDSLTWDLRGSDIRGGYLDYTVGPWQLRLGTTQVRFEHEIPIVELVGANAFAIAPELKVKGRKTRYDAIGIAYEDGPLEIQAMANRVVHDSEFYRDTRSAYVIGAYRIGSVTPYLGYSQIRSSAPDIRSPIPSGARPLIDLITSNFYAHQNTVALGVRWDVAPRIALKGQIDRIDGKPESIFPYRGETPDWDGDMTVFSVTMDFVF